MIKAKKYAINGAIGGGILAAIINVIDQNSGSKKDKPFNWKEFFLWLIGGATIGGGIGLATGAMTDHVNSLEEPLDLEYLLHAYLNSIRLNKKDQQYNALRKKSDWLIEVLRNEFKDDLKLTPYRFGSTEQGTALKETFDIDICLSFKPKTFTSITAMMNEVFTFLKKFNGINGIRHIRKQKKSVGLLFHVNGEEMKIDILPYQCSKKHKNDHSGYMCVNKGMFEAPSRAKTDVQLLSNIRLSETQKKILVILKDWKQKADIPISSHLLQYLILEAYKENEGHIPSGFAEKIIMTMCFIEENLVSIRLHGVENTNNVLTDIPLNKKEDIVLACGNVIDDFEYQPNSILQIIG
jgi:hypothetical protein